MASKKGKWVFLSTAAEKNERDRGTKRESIIKRRKNKLKGHELEREREVEREIKRKGMK